MPLFHWRLPALISTLRDDTQLARPLLLPGVSCYALEAEQLKELLLRRVTAVVKQLSADVRYRYLAGDVPEIRAVEVSVPPLHGDLLRRHPVRLRLNYAVWRHGEEAVIAYVPALDIEVLAATERQLDELLLPQLELALSRSGKTRSLRELVQLDRFRDLTVRTLHLKLRLPTLKEAAMREEQEATSERSLLKEVASNLAIHPSRTVYERNTEVHRLADLLTRRNAQSVLLVGRSGSGKTAIVQQLARQRDELGLGTTPLWSTSGSRMVAGMTGFGMWQERCESVVREASRTKTILHLGNLVELIEVGKGGGNTMGVAALLRPHLDRGDFLAIAECTPEQLAVIEREDPQLLETFTTLEVPTSTPEQTRAILQAVALEHSSTARISISGLATLDRLHRRWATYSAAPGLQLRFLRNLLDDHSPQKSEISASEVTQAFSRETGLPLFMLDDDVPLDLQTVRSFFTERVMGQIESVDLVVDLMAAVKTALARGGKPIASLLFIGPTGVGKTEMAKSLAEFLYQDRGRMIRFDMSEYADASAVERLIGGAYAAQGLLTQKVRDQPFMVVLLDECEKAHPLFFDMLLQVLGEGRLTDGLGRVTDFTNAVVIMTSNLGAESYRRGTAGFTADTMAAETAKHHFEREVRAYLRPELFNRIDRIVPFAPLDRATITGIARRELAQVANRHGVRFRKLKLTIQDAVIEHLAAIGTDSRYGARPLKRAIERRLVAPLAKGVNQYTAELPLSCTARLEKAELRVDTEPDQSPSHLAPAVSVTDTIELIVRLRRHIQALQQSSIVTRLRNEIERIRHHERAQAKRLKRRGLPLKVYFTPEQARLLGHEGLLLRIEELADRVFKFEDSSLMDLYASRAQNPVELEARRSDLDRAFRALLFELPQIDAQRHGLLTIAVYAESIACVVELMKLYQGIFHKHGGNPRWFWLKMYDEKNDESKVPEGRPFHPPPGPRPMARLLSRKESETDEREKVIDVYAPPPDPFDGIPENCIGIAVQLYGDRSVGLLETESGRHEFHRQNGERDFVYVEAVTNRLIDYDPPRQVGRRGSMNNLPMRRTYDLRAEECRDVRLSRIFPVQGRRLDQALEMALEEYLSARLWELVEAWS